MANTYESKFKGVEVDEGVNIARNLTGTGGIEVKKTATGTINATVTIDGSGVKITPVSGTGTSTTDVMSQKAVTDELGEKQEKLTASSNIHINSLMADQITLGNYSSGNIILLPQSGASGNVYFPKYGGRLATTNEVPAVVQIMGTGTTTVMSQKAVTDELGKKQDKLTTGSEISIKKLQATTIGAQDNGSLTIVDPLTVSNNVYVNELEATKGVFSSGAIVQGTLTGETAHFATGVTVDGYSSFNGIYVDNSTTNPICFKRNGGIVTKMYGPTSGGGELVNVYLPGKGGTLALTSDIPTGSGGGTTITVNGKVQSALKAAIYLSDVTGGVGDGETLALFDEYGGLNCADFNADYCYVAECTAQTSAQENYRTTIQPTGIYFEWTGGSYPDLDEGSNKTLTLCGPLSTSTTSGNVIRLPAKSGTVALLSDITGGGGSAGVSSIGGQTGAITLGTGLTIDGNNVLDVITHMNYVNMYLHRIIGKFDRSSGSYAIMISVYNGTEAEFTGDTLGNLIQQLFEYQYTSSIVIAKTDGSTVTSWDPTKFEQLYVGTIVDDTLYCNFNEMNIVPVQLYDIPFVSDIVEQIALPVS